MSCFLIASCHGSGFHIRANTWLNISAQSARGAAQAQFNTCLNVTWLPGLQYKGQKHAASFKFRGGNQWIVPLSFFLKLHTVSSIRVHPVLQYQTSVVHGWKKSFVYSQGNRSLLTHPPQLHLSQHNGWTITPPENNQWKCITLLLSNDEMGAHEQSINAHPVKKHKTQNPNTQLKPVKLIIKAALRATCGFWQNAKYMDRRKPYLGVGWSLFMWLFHTIFVLCSLAHSINKHCRAPAQHPPFTQSWILDEGAGPRPSLPNTIDTRLAFNSLHALAGYQLIKTIRERQLQSHNGKLTVLSIIDKISK